MVAERRANSVNNDYDNETDRLLETPYALRPRSTDLQAFVNTIKSFVGVGILEFPYAVYRSGLWAGIAFLFLIGLASNYTIKTLIRCKEEIKIRENKDEDTELTFGDVGYHTFGKFGEFLVNFAIISSQIGFCCAYVMFIATNLHSLHQQIPLTYYSLMYFPIFMLLAWIRNIKYLSPTSVLANCSLLFAVTVILYYGFKNIVWDKPYVGLDISGLPTFFGIAVFGFEGINLALPIESSMINPKNYSRILNISLMVVGVAYISFGALGYICFGSNIQSIITLNLPDGSPITIIVKLALIAELTFSYPVQLFPVSTISESYMFGPRTKYLLFKSCLFRTVLVAASVAIAIAIPHFDLFTALIGAFSNSLVTFIYPPIFLLFIFRSRLAKYEIVLNVLMLVMGLAASSISSYTAIKGIVETFFSR